MNNLHQLGIGIDIADIERFRNLNTKKDKSFFTKIYTNEEIKYCFSKADPAQHLAARFAGKEAILKAFSYYNIGIPLNQVEILNDHKGVPFVNLLCNNIDNFDIKISLSHSEAIAAAVAIVTKN